MKRTNAFAKFIFKRTRCHLWHENMLLGFSVYDSQTSKHWWFWFPKKRLPDPEVLWLSRMASRIGSSIGQHPGGLRPGWLCRWSWAGRSSPQWPSQRDGGPVDNVLIWGKKKIWCLVFRKMFAITSQARPGNSKEGFILAVIVRPVRNILRTKKVILRNRIPKMLNSFSSINPNETHPLVSSSIISRYFGWCRKYTNSITALWC